MTTTQTQNAAHDAGRHDARMSSHCPQCYRIANPIRRVAS